MHALMGMGRLCREGRGSNAVASSTFVLRERVDVPTARRDVGRQTHFVKYNFLDFHHIAISGDTLLHTTGL
eukprot:scaffold13351_cov194-Alexandrium_tamarense.AAC.4